MDKKAKRPSVVQQNEKQETNLTVFIALVVFALSLAIANIGLA